MPPKESDAVHEPFRCLTIGNHDLNELVFDATENLFPGGLEDIIFFQVLVNGVFADVDDFAQVFNIGVPALLGGFECQFKESGLSLSAEGQTLTRVGKK